MIQFSQKFLTPSAILALIASYFVFLFPSSNANGQSSSIEFIEGTEEYNLRELAAIFLLFLILICLLTWLLQTLKHRTKKRKSFSIQTRNLVLKNQKFKCSICRMNAGIWDYDHKDGNRGNNKASNCQALCPICHAKKSRGLIKCEAHRRSKSIGLSVVVGIILIIILYSNSV
jgi:hypothetical protein